MDNPRNCRIHLNDARDGRYEFAVVASDSGDSDLRTLIEGLIILLPS